MQSKIQTTTLVNIDSAFRNIIPKNICTSNNTFLPLNPFIINNNNTIIINYPNHNLQVNDNIVIKNTKGFNKILINEFYLINNFNYLLINLLESNLINLDNMNLLPINISIFGKFTETNFFNNIPFNSIIGIKNCIIGNNIKQISDDNKLLDTFKTILKSSLNTLTINNYLDKYCLFIELPTIYINTTNDYYQIQQIFNIEYLHINGINLGYINSDYPINNINYQSSQEIDSIIDENNFIIKIYQNGYNNNVSSGGNNIIINKIINSIDGYPDANNYIINLKKNFTNIINIQLVSTEFPYTDMLVKKNINDKLYWQNIEDGFTIYSIQIDEGFYTADQLLLKISTLMNNVERITSTSINKIYNNFNIILESTTHIISFYSYYLINLPNSLSISQDTINLDTYYILNIYHPNNIVNINDTILISNSNMVTFKLISNSNIQIFSIDSSYINKSFTVSSINPETQSYNIILGKNSEISITLVNYESAGGENTTIKTNSQSSFLFNKSDTIGNELGFINVNNPYSITDFKFIITNNDTYLNSNIVNAVGNLLNYSHGFFNFAGNYNYFLMYLNDIQFVYTNNITLQPAFAKILLSGNPGDILFNTFVEQPNNLYDKIFPIASCDTFTINFIYPDGNSVNFKNLNHSFTLKITEEKIQNEFTYLNSKKINLNPIHVL